MLARMQPRTVDVFDRSADLAERGYSFNSIGTISIEMQSPTMGPDREKRETPCLRLGSERCWAPLLLLSVRALPPLHPFLPPSSSSSSPSSCLYSSLLTGTPDVVLYNKQAAFAVCIARCTVVPSTSQIPTIISYYCPNIPHHQHAPPAHSNNQTRHAEREREQSRILDGCQITSLVSTEALR